MPKLDPDGRFKFNTTVNLSATTPSTLSVDIYGGPIARIMATLFNAKDEVIATVGQDGHLLSTETNGSASWLFQAVPQASYLKWYIWANRSAANIPNFSITVKVRDSSGNALATAQCAGVIPEGQWSLPKNDPIVDGILVSCK